MSEASCPKCGFERDPDAAECPVCGIFFARYRGDADSMSQGRDESVDSGFGFEAAESRQEQNWGSDPPQMYAGTVDESIPGAHLDSAAMGYSGSGVFEPQSYDGAPLAMPGLRDDNPYAAPRALVVDVEPIVSRGELARRGTRLAARLLDLLILFGTVTVTVAVPAAMIPDYTTSGVNTMFLVIAVAVLALVGYNIVLLHRTGQTIGKKALKIRIVRFDGERASLGRLIGLRWVVPGMLGAVPIVGGVFALLNVLFIFREDQRCIHDHLADTKVVLA